MSNQKQITKDSVAEISVGTLDEVLKYLAGRPYGEVHKVIALVQRAKVVENGAKDLEVVAEEVIPE